MYTSDGIGSARPDFGLQPDDPTTRRPDSGSGSARRQAVGFGFGFGSKVFQSGRVRVDSSYPTDPTTRQPDNPTQLKHENDQPFKKKLTKISKKCLELLYSMKICNFGRLLEKFQCGKSVFGEKLFLPSIFVGLSGRSGRSRVGLLNAVGSSGRPDDRPSGSGPGSGRSFFVGFGFGSEKPTRSHH